MRESSLDELSLLDSSGTLLPQNDGEIGQKYRVILNEVKIQHVIIVLYYLLQHSEEQGRESSVENDFPQAHFTFAFGFSNTILPPIGVVT